MSRARAGSVEFMGARSSKQAAADGDQFPPEEAARRRDEVVRRMLNTPPQPHRPKPRAEDREERAVPKSRAPRPKPRP